MCKGVMVMKIFNIMIEKRRCFAILLLILLCFKFVNTKGIIQGDTNAGWNEKALVSGKIRIQLRRRRR
jgi:hypothetical protein